MALVLPKAVQAFLDSRTGNPSPAYRRWMEDLTRALNAAGSAEDLQALIDHLSTDGTIEGIPEPTELQLVQGVGIKITGGNTIALRELADSGSGAFKLLTRDSYGRVSGTADGTAADVPYDNDASGLAAEDVQAALDELAAGGGYSDEQVDDRVDALLAAQDYLLKHYDDTANLLRLYGLNPYATYLVDSSGNYLRDSSGNLITTDNDGFPIPQAFGGTGVAGGGTTQQFLRGDGVYSDTLTGTLLIVGDGGGMGGLDLTRYSNDTAPATVRSFKSRGTLASPLPLNAGDSLVFHQGRGRHSGGAFSGNVGALDHVTLEGFTNTAQGTAWEASVVAIGSTSRVIVLRIDAVATAPAADNAYSSGKSTARWSAVHAVNTFRYGAIFDTGTVTPAQLTANTDNWAVTGLGAASTIRASTDASRNLTGIASPTAGQRVALINVGAFDLVLVHDATSTAANRFLCPNSANLTLNPNDSVTLWYDTTSSRWRVIGT